MDLAAVGTTAVALLLTVAVVYGGEAWEEDRLRGLIDLARAAGQAALLILAPVVFFAGGTLLLVGLGLPPLVAFALTAVVWMLI